MYTKKCSYICIDESIIIRRFYWFGYNVRARAVKDFDPSPQTVPGRYPHTTAPQTWRACWTMLTMKVVGFRAGCIHASDYAGLY